MLLWEHHSHLRIPYQLRQTTPKLSQQLSRSKMVLPVPLYRLQCGVNSYEWGKKGNDSAAARFAAATPSDDLSIQADKPYAEVG